jgi:hypothetical protein
VTLYLTVAPNTDHEISGYISRNGIVTAGEVIQATSEGFNMAADLSGLLVLVAVAFTGNLATEKFSIGGEDSRTYSATGIGSKEAGRQFGLDGHSRCEGDISATREDFFLNNGLVVHRTRVLDKRGADALTIVTTTRASALVSLASQSWLLPTTDSIVSRSPTSSTPRMPTCLWPRTLVCSSTDTLSS